MIEKVKGKMGKGNSAINSVSKLIKKRKKLAIALGVIFALLLLLIISGAFSKKEAPLEVRTIEKGDIVQTVSTDATAQTSFSRDIISSQPLEIVEVKAEVGQEVKAGDVLGQLKTDDLKEAVAQAKLNVEQAGISKQQAEQQLKSAQLENDIAQTQLSQMPATIDEEPSVRSAWLTMDGLPAGHQKELAKVQYAAAVQAATNSRNQIKWNAERAANSLETAKIALGQAVDGGDSTQVKIANANLASAQRKLNDATIKAPSDGIVSQVFAKVGQTAAGTLFRIESASHLKLSAQIDEYDISKIKLGQKVTINSDTLDEPLSGEVSKIPVVADSSSNSGTSVLAGAVSATFTIEINITSENIGKLLSGMTVTANIVVDEVEGILKVPTSALSLNKQGKSEITLLKDGKQTQVIVETGIESDLETQIISDEIKEGDQYVITERH